MQKYKKALTFLELLIVISSIIILTMISVPEYPRQRPSARQKSCYSNMRVLMGAVEMYNMDHSIMMKELDQKKLISEKYLKGPELTCPESYEKGTYSGTKLDDVGEVICSYHGGLITEGKYDKEHRY
jgi:competence protein ComGC